jgi:hypothetical protein
MESVMSEFREAFKSAKGYGHADSDEMNQAGTGINVMTRLMGLILAALAVEVMADGLHKLFPVLARGT